MVVSLKSTLPKISQVLGLTANALYVRQQMLVEEGLLDIVSGRGPGSGVHASAESIALLVIGAIAGLGVSPTGAVARSISNFKTLPTAPCKLTDQTVFRKAFARLLSDQTLTSQVHIIRVGVTHGSAEIEFNSRPGFREQKRSLERNSRTLFLGPLAERTAMRVDAALGFDTVHALTQITLEAVTP